MDRWDAKIESDDEGGLVVMNAVFPYEVFVNVPAHVFTGLGMFDEGSDHFLGWDGECDMAAEIVALALGRYDYSPAIQDGYQRLQRAVRQACVPGPGFEAHYTFPIARPTEVTEG